MLDLLCVSVGLVKLFVSLVFDAFWIEFLSSELSFCLVFLAASEVSLTSDLSSLSDLGKKTNR